MECKTWFNMDANQQYHSKLYKLTSKLFEIYPNTNPTVFQVADFISIEYARRVAENLSKKS